MAYNANQHSKFTDRMTNFMRAIWQLKQEAASLTAIYQQETSYGAHADFVDGADITKQELIDAIVFQEAYTNVITGAAAISQTDRTANVTPFLSGE